MTEFERMLVNSFNAYIEENGVRAISYRLKQHRFTSQFLDVLVILLILTYTWELSAKVSRWTKVQVHFISHNILLLIRKEFIK